LTEFALSLIAIGLHELGHIAVARFLGIPVISYSFKLIGISIKFDFSGAGYIREGAVHLGGPIFGLVSALITLVFFRENSYFFCGISTVLSCINLMPIRGFDGSGVLSCILSHFCFPEISEKIQRAVSFFFLIVLWVAVLWIELRVGANLSLLAFVLFFMINTT